MNVWVIEWLFLWVKNNCFQIEITMIVWMHGVPDPPCMTLVMMSAWNMCHVQLRDQIVVLCSWNRNVTGTCPNSSQICSIRNRIFWNLNLIWICSVWNITFLPNVMLEKWSPIVCSLISSVIICNLSNKFHVDAVNMLHINVCLFDHHMCLSMSNSVADKNYKLLMSVYHTTRYVYFISRSVCGEGDFMSYHCISVCYMFKYSPKP